MASKITKARAAYLRAHNYSRQLRKRYMDRPTPAGKREYLLAKTRAAKLRDAYFRLKGGASKPRIITAAAAGLTFENRFGALGPELYLTGHHTAGPIPKTRDGEIALFRQYHAAHKAKGWGGEGYHYGLLRDGTLLCLRPTALKGTHVGLHNSNNIGVACHGTIGDKPTDAQMATFRWLLANAHTSAMPKAHRTDRDLRQATRRGHNDWSGHESNACPGTHKRMYLSGGQER